MPGVTLDPGEYWKLVALGTRVEYARAEAERAVQAAALARDTEIRRICAVHGLSPDRPLRTDDATLTLTQDDTKE